eukprot:4005941-Pyramimonas_sp.AAC.1
MPLRSRPLLFCAAPSPSGLPFPGPRASGCRLIAVVLCPLSQCSRQSWCATSCFARERRCAR